jgi:hypothetical protein
MSAKIQGFDTRGSAPAEDLSAIVDIERFNQLQA